MNSNERNWGVPLGEHPEAQALTTRLTTASQRYHLQLPEQQALVDAVYTFLREVQPAALVEELHLGYQPQEQTYNTLALLSTDWRPLQSAEPHPLTTEEQRHRLLSTAKRDVWQRYPTLLFDVYPANPHRFAHADAQSVFAKVMPTGTLYLGTVPFPGTVAPPA